MFREIIGLLLRQYFMEGKQCKEIEERERDNKIALDYIIIGYQKQPKFDKDILTTSYKVSRPEIQIKLILEISKLLSINSRIELSNKFLLR